MSLLEYKLILFGKSVKQLLNLRPTVSRKQSPFPFCHHNTFVLIKEVEEAQWHHDYCAQLRIKGSWFEPWLGTLCCVLGQDTLLSQCPSPPRCIRVPTNLMLGGNPAMNLHPIQRGVEILLVASCY